jgi:hypothetical protein
MTQGVRFCLDTYQVIIILSKGPHNYSHFILGAILNAKSAVFVIQAILISFQTVNYDTRLKSLVSQLTLRALFCSSLLVFNSLTEINLLRIRLQGVTLNCQTRKRQSFLEFDVQC